MKIETTFDYSRFKRLEGNRPVSPKRVKKIIDSINNVGYIANPIIVNDSFEVIDGQGRLEALKQLGLPVQYIISPDASIEECRSMNINQTNWSDRDYIRSFAESGNIRYKQLEHLLGEFKTDVSITLCALLDTLVFTGGGTTRAVRSGELNFTDDDYKRAKFELGYLKNLHNVITTIGGRKEYPQRALLYAYRNLTVLQRQELEKILQKNAYMLPAFTKIGDWLKCFDNYYNKGKQKKSRINLHVLWETDNL